MSKSSIKRSLKELSGYLQGDKHGISAINYLLEQIEKIKFDEMPLVAGEFPLPQEVIQSGGVALFADGASRGNPGPGAWGALGQSADGKILFEASSVDTYTTNNKMELEGAIAALSWLLDNGSEVGFDPQCNSVFLYSDSKYVVDGTMSWMPGWKRRGWKKADKKVPENLELWQEMDRLIAKFAYLKLIWVKGHNGHPQNEHCDQLANKALNEAGF